MKSIDAPSAITHPLRTSRDLDVLLEYIGNARYVLLGEASHGTHEFYAWRTAISKRLIEEHGFSFIAVEGDWPDCYRINRYIKNTDPKATKAIDALGQVCRWPTWMWANWEVAALAEWMREYNRHRKPKEQAGFYGLDVYSLWESMDVMVHYLRKEDPDTARLAIDALRCFEPYEEGHDYARAIMQLSSHCTAEVIKLLKEVRKRAHHYDHDREAALNAEMNAQVIANAEEYYRSMIGFQGESWNVRDRHMVSTLEALQKFHGKESRCIVWAHNSHVGDARYTDMKGSGLINVGQLVREQHKKDDVYIVGFSSYQGAVIAGKSWGAPMEEMTVPPAVSGSVEERLHREDPQDRIILFGGDKSSTYAGHRAIGVVYNPANERGNYVPTALESRYDALLYIDSTTALHPLHITADGSQIPETYPFGL